MMDAKADWFYKREFMSDKFVKSATYFLGSIGIPANVLLLIIIIKWWNYYNKFS